MTAARPNQSTSDSEVFGHRTAMSALDKVPGARYLLAFLQLVLLGLLWWRLAGDPGGGKFFDAYTKKAFLALLAASYVVGWGVYFVLRRQPTRIKILNCALSTSSLVLILGLLELPAALGWVDYGLLIAPPESVLLTRLKPWQRPSNQPDPELLHIHRPGLRFTGETTGDLVGWLRIATDRRYRVVVQYDRHGFRNDHEIARAPVVVIGDSFVESGLVPQGELFTTRLGQMLSLEVANLGQGGYGPQQESVVLQRFGLPLKPRVILWFFFEGNDLLDVHRYEEFKQDMERSVRSPGEFSTRSFTANAIQTLQWLSIPKPKEDSPEAVRRSCQLRTGNGGLGHKIYFAYPGQPLSKKDLAALEVLEKQLGDAQRSAAESGVHFLVVYIPTKFRVYGEFCEFPENGYGREWRPNDLPARLEEWTRDNGIAFLDLTPALQQVAADGELAYYPDDGHWNAKGHEVVAEAVAEFLRSRKWDVDLEASKPR